MASAINRLLGNQKKTQQPQNNGNLIQQFNNFYNEYVASGKDPMAELQQKVNSGQISQAQLQDLISKAKQIAPLIRR